MAALADRESRPTNAPPVSLSAPLLSVRGLGKTFERRRGLRRRSLAAVTDVSFDVAAGEAVALVGESGCGKTTIARLIARLITPTTGELRLRGEDVLISQRRGPSRDYRSLVQMIFQDPFSSLNPVHTVEYHLERPLRLHGQRAGRAERQSQVHRLLEAVGLEPAAELARRLPHQLSGGQRQRVSIARALAANPALIVADEPTSMVDVSIRFEILALLRTLMRERGIGCLYITHDLGTARSFADRIVVIHEGVVVETGPSDRVLIKPQHPYTIRLLQSIHGSNVAPILSTDGAKLSPAGLSLSPRHEGDGGWDRFVLPGDVRPLPPLREVAPGHFVREVTRQRQAD